MPEIGGAAGAHGPECFDATRQACGRTKRIVELLMVSSSETSKTSERIRCVLMCCKVFQGPRAAGAKRAEKRYEEHPILSQSVFPSRHPRCLQTYKPPKPLKPSKVEHSKLLNPEFCVSADIISCAAVASGPDTFTGVFRGHYMCPV